MIYNTETQHILLCPNTVLVLELLEYQELLDQVMNTNGHTSSASKVTQKKNPFLSLCTFKLCYSYRLDLMTRGSKNVYYFVTVDM